MTHLSSCHFKCFSLLCAAVFVFVYWPGLDLWVSNFFYAGSGYFPANDVLLVKGIYHLTPWFGRLIFAIALVVVLTSIFFQAKVSRRQWRRSSALVAVVIIGVGFFVHSVLKDGMGRPRPRDIQAYAGVTHYMPVLQPSSFCQTNCSFVSGHAAVGFSLMAFGMFGIRKRRQFWMLTALATGTLIGFARIAQGGHFLSDIVFSYLAIWISFLATRTVWLRFRVWQLRTSLPDVLEVSQR